jgi:hypothetical protein
MHRPSTATSTRVARKEIRERAYRSNKVFKVTSSGFGLLRIILAAPEACILRTQTREGAIRFCRTLGEPWRGSASLAAC